MSARKGAVFLVLFSILFSAQPARASTSFDQILSDFERQYQLPSGCLAKIARAESNGNPNARNASTDAVGLFQWLPRSWEYATRALYGRVLGLEERRDPTEAARVTTFSLRQIKNALGGLVAEARIDECLGLYMGHFLGQSGAQRFLRAYIQDPNANACTIFSRECRYNRSVLNRTLAGVLQEMARRLGTSAPQINIAGNFENTFGLPDSRTSGNITADDFMPASYKPVGQDFARTYPATFQPTSQSLQAYQPSVSSLLTTDSGVVERTAPPPAALLSVQPREVKRGELGLVSWSTVGMSPKPPCKITVISVGKEVLVGQSNEGSRQIRIGTNSLPGTFVFTLRCTALQKGTTIERRASLVVK